jgi:hypothetical protein
MYIIITFINGFNSHFRMYISNGDQNDIVFFPDKVFARINLRMHVFFRNAPATEYAGVRHQCKGSKW